MEQILTQSLAIRWLPFFMVGLSCVLMELLCWWAISHGILRSQSKNIVLWTKILVAMLPFLCGGFYLWSYVLVSAMILTLLMLLQKGRGTLRIHWNIGLVSLTFVCIAYLGTGFWGVDVGSGLVGGLKCLPLLLFYILIMQFERDEREALKQWLPLGGSCMVVMAILCGFVPVLEPFIWVNGRLTGFFQYANAFAIFLLYTMIYLLISEKPFGIKVTLFSIMLVGLLLSGSRATIAVGVLLGVILVVRWYRQRKNVGLFWIGFSLVFCIGAGVMGFNPMLRDRILMLPTESSTFWGRILYIYDVIPQILIHPLGLGVDGYYYAQGSFQTGIYAQRYVHNELLQLFIDVGWVPTLLVCVFLITAFRRATAENRILMLTLILHAQFDFDFQFLALGILLLLSVHESVDKEGWKRRDKAGQRLLLVGSGIVLAMGVNVALADLAHHMKEEIIAVCFYPLHTPSKLQLLVEETDVVAAGRLADDILQENKMVSIAYSAKANEAFSKGDAETFMFYKRQAIQLAPYTMAEYEDYMIKLHQFTQLYLQHGMISSGTICAEELQSIPEQIEQMQQRTSPMAWKIAEKPRLELSPVMEEILRLYQ